MPGAHVQTDLWVNEYISPYDIYQRGIKKVYVHKQTQYQEMLIAQTGQGKTLVLDGKFQSTEADDFMYHEPLVHPAMIFHGAPKKVLIIGGGEGATVREALRWKSVERVVMVDIDGEVVEECKKHMPEFHQGAFDDPRTEFLAMDAFEFLDQTEEVFDVIISDLCDPLEDGPAFYLFTKESYEKVFKRLSEDGFFLLQGGPLSLHELHVHGRLHNTLRAVFPHVISMQNYVAAYITLWGFLLASRKPIDLTIDQEKVNQILKEMVKGELTLMDGEALQSMMLLPKHIRTAIAANPNIFTMDNPPEVFGGGVMSES